MRAGTASFAVAAVAAALLSPVTARAATPAAEVNAEGNVFTGGLAFDPPNVSVKIGEVVRWTNTDNVVPHTATEDHELWDLTGTYGQTPANPPGFGPGESRERAFEAGTQHYFCRVHPAQMKGIVAVPVRLERAATLRPKPRPNERHLLATWAVLPPVAGQVYDVEVRRSAGAWRGYRTGTRAISTGIRTRKGVKWSVRARLRSASDPKAATDWSPVVFLRG